MNQKLPQPRTSILSLPEYVPGERQLDGILEPIKLSSNESNLGPSPNSLKAYSDALTNIHRYPDPDQHQIREIIADHHELSAENIVCGNGSAEMIQMLIQTYVDDGDEVLLSEFGFPLYQIFALSQGAKVVFAPEMNCVTQIDALLKRVNSKTKLIALANPNNPTGTYLKKDEIKKLHLALPDQVLLLLDEAYAEYVTANDYESGLQWAVNSKNVVVTRTFSKFYGLAGLRLGWMYGPLEIIASVQRIRITFNVNGPSMAAAIAALQDKEYADKVKKHNAYWRERMTRELENVGLQVIHSMANFILIHFGDEEGRTNVDADNALKSRGILPRPLSGGSPQNCLRITIGKKDENEAVLETMNNFMQNQ
tara:strand:- start:8219 stop:9319 length:1101 start_codon:yes stop_codon:yes gene_type:complete